MTEARLLPSGPPGRPGPFGSPPVSRREARAAGRERRERRKRRKRRGPVGRIFRLFRELALILVSALVLSLVIKTFLLQAFFIPSPSMESTLVRGDRVVVSKLTPGPFELKRGDVVVFADPGGWLPSVTRTPGGPVTERLRAGLTFVGLIPADSDEHLIKRLIGLPGDTVACCDEQGRLTVNGTAVDEPYLFAGDLPSADAFSVTVPAGRIWVMGDHRSVSEDSRYHRDLDQGMVPISGVVGRAVATVWPLDRATVLRNPSSTFAEVSRP